MKFNFFLVISIVLFLLTLNCSKTVETEKVFAERTENKEVELKNEEINSLKIEIPEEKAVRIAEEFIARNGYTHSLPDKDNLSYEAVEFYKNIDELLAFRRDTLEPKAYGILQSGRRRNEKGWTVVFRHSQRLIKRDEKERAKFPSDIKLSKIGRVVTIDENFGNLLVEHKDFPLSNVEKRLEN